jgi:hypothetical protein
MTSVSDHPAEISLTAAFPHYLRADIETLLMSIGETKYPKAHGFQIRVTGEDLVIPYRIDYKADPYLFDALSGTQRVIYACILSRHLDGHMRQRQLETILAASEAWIAPFVIRLAGEYVMEILHPIEVAFPALDHAIYANFIKDNPAFYKLMRERMISYWDCYYRWLYKNKNDYVGFRLFSHFDAIAKN